MMHGTFGPLSERYLEYARLINNSGSHLLSLVADILDLAKIEAGRFQADFREFDLKACVEDCLPLIAPRAAAREIVLEADLPGAATLVMADARACKQILINLLSNAVKFSEERGIITVSLKDLGETVQFSVRDEGAGIPADVLERIVRRALAALPRLLLEGPDSEDVVDVVVRPVYAGEASGVRWRDALVVTFVQARMFPRRRERSYFISAAPVLPPCWGAARRYRQTPAWSARLSPQSPRPTQRPSNKERAHPPPGRPAPRRSERRATPG